jgi:ABC-2 type transport system ATP-binding protein
VCDTAAILDRGHVVARAPIDDLMAGYGVQKVVVEVTGGALELASEIGRQEWVTAVRRGHNGAIEVTVTDVDRAQREIPVMVAARRIGLSRFEAGEMGLEAVFVELVGDKQR